MFMSAGILKAEVAVSDLTLRGGNQEDRAKYLSQDIKFWGSAQYPGEEEFTGRLIKMRTANTYFVLWLSGKTDSATGEFKGKVGMPGPSKANWYESDFYNVLINGKPVTDYKMTVDEVSGGEKGTVKISWHHPDAVVTAEFTLLDGDDKLVAVTSVQPKAKIPGYEISLTAYPSSFGGDYSRGLAIRDREGMTASRILAREKKEDNLGNIRTDLNKNEPWILFYDKYFDKAENRGDGPCAALYSPEEVKTATAVITNYGCHLKILYPETEKPVSSVLVFWDFTGMANQAAAEYMKNLEIAKTEPAI